MMTAVMITPALDTRPTLAYVVRELYVDGRDRSKLVEGVLGQIEVVRRALGEEFADVPVRGVLCFVGCEWAGS
jgi:hypothetical protein